MTTPATAQHTPCGCTAKHTDETPSGYKWGDVVITYCAKHAAADALLASLERIAYKPTLDAITMHDIAVAVDAIRKAKGE